MAERRMIHKKISLSEQFNDMSEFAQLLFAMMIPHADDWGVVKGTARVVRGTVIPLNEARSVEDVEAALSEMEAQRLVWRYEPAGEGPMLQFRKWEEHQTGLSKRTAPTQKLYLYPEDARRLLEEKGVDWDYEEFHGTSGNFSEVQGSSPRTEEKGTELEDTPSETRKRKDLLQHWAMKCYHHVVHRHMKGVLRQPWAEFADTHYVEGDDEQKFEDMKTDLKTFMAMGYYEGNVDWFVEWVEQGKPEKWKRGKRGAHKQGAKSKYSYFDEVAARRQAERDAELDAAN